MEVLVLGLPRTGTQSIANALQELGIDPIYHMREVAKNGHQAQWIELLEEKFERKSKSVDSWREDLDRILGGFTGAADYPASIFASELITAYPNAKVILTVRSEDSWYASMMATLWTAWKSSSPGLSSMRSLRDKIHHFLWDSDFPANGRQLFHEHNELVREIAPKDRFFEYDVKMGGVRCVHSLGKMFLRVHFQEWMHGLHISRVSKLMSARNQNNKVLKLRWERAHGKNLRLPLFGLR